MTWPSQVTFRCWQVKLNCLEFFAISTSDVEITTLYISTNNSDKWQTKTNWLEFWPNFNKRHTHTRLTALYPGLPRWAGTRKVKPIWILLKQEIVSGSGIRWAICKSAPRSRQITTPIPHHSVFTGRMPFLPPNQQRQSTEGTSTKDIEHLWQSQVKSGIWLKLKF